MTRIVLTPLCICRAGTRDPLASIQGILGSASAHRLGLRAVVQACTVSSGYVAKDGKPLFLLRDPATGRITTVDPARAPDGADGFGDDIQALCSLAEAAGIPDPFREDMPGVLPHRFWLVTLPRMVVMQAESVAKELRAISSLHKHLHRSTWARAAYATFCLPPPASAHESLVALRSIREALALLREFRPEVFAEAEANGYDIGPVTAADLECALAAG